jgi:hypothetical protein
LNGPAIAVPVIVAVAAEVPAPESAATSAIGVASAVVLTTIVVAAFADTAVNPPSVIAATATSAIRFVIVFVDIIFLSRKVAVKNFFTTAWSEIAFS